MKHKKHDAAGLQNVYVTNKPGSIDKPTSARELRNTIAESRATILYVSLSLFVYFSTFLTMALFGAKVFGATFSWGWVIFPPFFVAVSLFGVFWVIIQNAHNDGINVKAVADSDYPIKRKLSILFGAKYKGMKL